MTTNIQTKDTRDLVCVQLEVHIWSGRRILTKSDLIHANEEFAKLPEKDLANLGSVKICDPEDIKAFQKLKNKAELVLKRSGLPFLGATGVPSKKYPKADAELTAIQAEFTTLAQQFVAKFAQKVESWKMKHLLSHPEWEQLFRDLPTADHVGGRLAFQFHPYSVGPPADASNPELNKRFERQVGGLKGELLREVADEAGSFISSLNPTKTDDDTRKFVTPKTLGPLRRAAEKLDAFAFIDPTIGPLAELITNMLDGLPDKGRIDGKELLLLSGIARLLNDSRGIAELSTIAFNGGTAEQAVNSLVSIKTAAPSPIDLGATVGPVLVAPCEEQVDGMIPMNRKPPPVSPFDGDQDVFI